MSLFRGLWLLLGTFTVVSVWAQGARVVYEQDDNFLGVTTEFRSPWNGSDVGNNNFMSAPTGVFWLITMFSVPLLSSVSVCRTSLVETHLGVW